ncbi:four helix bundle protein [Planctomicrobium piriforme]|uniref:Four helix bundle protein n=1 Tax=Planctomicrobium piriforme TaxID=1576369 RepID=A0A1I3DGY2_9PLAN|nr:four helix bundle protein [Planctomicrobium piriforme]SFH86032.1 four helix bundle protein [Planctomicrobium piriforme]
MFGFERLDAWQLAVEYADLIYHTTRSFPADERFGITNQLRRASVSIAANLAEGSGRGSNKDFVRFIQIAFGSLMEVVSHLTIAKRQGFVSDPAFDELYRMSQRLAKVLSGLRTSLAD